MPKYILKNKDKNVLEFEVETESKTFEGQSITYTSLKNASIIDESSLPKQILPNDLLNSLKTFIKHRKVPSHRQFVRNILASISTNTEDNLMAYIDISLGLSLNDSFWIVPSDKNYRWQDYNLYDNEFSEALELSAFGLKLTKVNGFVSSPEFTTNGMLKKCWHRDNGQIYLYKGSNKNDNNIGEAYSEYYMAQVAKIMEFDYVPYDLKLFHNELVSTCPIFTSENEGYMPMYYLLKESPKNYDKLELMLEVSHIYGNESFRDLMLFDALICNIDRHLGNFGMIVDNDTNEILRPAPIFDNGLSLMTTLDKSQFVNASKYLVNDTSYFNYKFNEQLKLFSQERHIPNLEKLSIFSFQRHPEFNLSEEWLQPIEKCIRKRAIMALKFIEEKKQSNITNTLNETTQTKQDIINKQETQNNLKNLIEKIDQAEAHRQKADETYKNGMQNIHTAYQNQAHLKNEFLPQEQNITEQENLKQTIRKRK